MAICNSTDFESVVYKAYCIEHVAYILINMKFLNLKEEYFLIHSEAAMLRRIKLGTCST